MTKGPSHAQSSPGPQQVLSPSLRGQDKNALLCATLVGRRALVPARRALLAPVRANVPTRVVCRSPRAVGVSVAAIPAVPVPATPTVTTPMSTSMIAPAIRATVGPRRRNPRPRPSAGCRLLPTFALARAALLPVAAGLRPAKIPVLARLVQLQQTLEPAVHAWLDAAVQDLRPESGVHDLVPLRPCHQVGRPAPKEVHHGNKKYSQCRLAGSARRAANQALQPRLSLRTQSGRVSPKSESGTGEAKRRRLAVRTRVTSPISGPLIAGGKLIGQLDGGTVA